MNEGCFFTQSLSQGWCYTSLFDTNSKAPPGLSWSVVIDHGSTQENSEYPPPETNLYLLKSEELSQTFMLANTAQKYSVNF